MSIIYDALKKLEKSNAAAPEIKPAASKHSKVTVYLVYLFVAMLGALTTKILFGVITNYPQKGKLTVAKNLGSTPNKTPDKLPEALPALALPVSSAGIVSAQTADARKTDLPRLVLSGIVFSPYNSYALINNKIVKQGDKINGATVERINEDNVELKTENSSFKLTSNSAKES